MTDQAATNPSEAVTETDVVAYLKDNPDFFLHQDELLRSLTLPHDSGRAISLVERQVHLFREQRDTLRRELGELIDIARHNDRLFEKSKQLLMQVIEARTLTEVASVLDDCIRNDFGLDATSLVILDERAGEPTPDGALLRVQPERARERFSGLLEGQRAVCGQFRDDQREFLFPERDTPVASVALVPLRHQSLIGLLAIGSHETGYFDESMGSLFLTYISDTLSRLLPPLISRHDRAGRIAAPVTGTGQ
ncbi:hypothetical protein C8D92_104165 [Tamilnaduibacter salinus]|uniref:DUF484 domain-containing protein n=1 Tax=Tamilnaduibacter salinus TaxID=1484056 RepID=A0A2A2I2B3_9GAMM|nr:DUF484 family protein [Tamilnaduibacter salinus]PAV25424.1 hypothetical protein CF392_10930 [Tamilnaduibacter salinus]PVY76933.1 hypothetical protein C8D92_104165 [Tamilnaduibacter salinus]